MRTKRLLAVVAAIFIAGCSKELPKCSDKQTLDLAKDLFAKEFAEIGGKITGTNIDPKTMIAKFRLEHLRASGYDEKVKKYTCEADLVDSDGRQMAVSYTSQLNDQGEHLVFTPHFYEEIGAAVMRNSFAALATPKNTPHPPQEKTVVPDLSKYVGKPSIFIFNDPSLDAKLKALLGNDKAEYDHFMNNLALSDDIEERDGFYLGGGSAPHLHNFEDVQFSINKNTGELYIEMLSEGKNQKCAGAESGRAPFFDWCKEDNTTIEENKNDEK